jgi:hypothetical protein
LRLTNRQPGDESFIRIIDFGRPSDVYLNKFINIYMCKFMCNNQSKIDVDRKKMRKKKEKKKNEEEKRKEQTSRNDVSRTT